mmetsp:Transcript_109621/g.316972  ORF Transcript_109621/g.316972 Transcript_109621/m.316972 type:complete len:269 (+) Transcript_109621:300-1106(+)
MRTRCRRAPARRATSWHQKAAGNTKTNIAATVLPITENTTRILWRSMLNSKLLRRIAVVIAPCINGVGSLEPRRDASAHKGKASMASTFRPQEAMSSCKYACTSAEGDCAGELPSDASVLMVMSVGLSVIRAPSGDSAPPCIVGNSTVAAGDNVASRAWLPEAINLKAALRDGCINNGMFIANINPKQARHATMGMSSCAKLRRMFPQTASPAQAKPAIPTQMYNKAVAAQFTAITCRMRVCVGRWSSMCVGNALKWHWKDTPMTGKT